MSEDDFKILDFPKEEKKVRENKSQLFEKSLENYHKTLLEAEKKLIASHHTIELDL